MGATAGANKDRKLLLEKRRLIRCGHCRYHRVENQGRQARPDRYKDRRRT